MIELSNTADQVLTSGQSITFDKVLLKTGCADARKHYTKTGSSEDKERMERHGEEHVEKAIISMRDIWSEASPELKRKMKTELSTLVDNMTI